MQHLPQRLRGWASAVTLQQCSALLPGKRVRVRVAGGATEYS